MGRQRAAAFVVRVAGLLSAGHDGMLGDTIALHQCHIDQFLDSLRCENLPIEPKDVVTDLCATQAFMRGSDGRFGGSLRGFDMPDFLV